MNFDIVIWIKRLFYKVNSHTHTHASVHACTHTHIHASMHACKHTHTHTHTTHTHTQRRNQILPQHIHCLISHVLSLFQNTRNDITINVSFFIYIAPCLSSHNRKMFENKHLYVQHSPKSFTMNSLESSPNKNSLRKCKEPHKLEHRIKKRFNVGVLKHWPCTKLTPLPLTLKKREKKDNN